MVEKQYTFGFGYQSIHCPAKKMTMFIKRAGRRPAPLNSAIIEYFTIIEYSTRMYHLDEAIPCPLKKVTMFIKKGRAEGPPHDTSLYILGSIFSWKEKSQANAFDAM